MDRQYIWVSKLHYKRENINKLKSTHQAHVYNAYTTMFYTSTYFFSNDSSVKSTHEYSYTCKIGNIRNKLKNQEFKRERREAATILNLSTYPYTSLISPSLHTPTLTMTLPFFFEFITWQQFLLGDCQLHAQTKPKNPILLGLVYKAELPSNKFNDSSDKLNNMRTTYSIP